MQEESFDYRQELYSDVARVLSGNTSGEDTAEKAKRELMNNIKGFRKLRLKGLAKMTAETVLFGGFIFGASCLGYAFKDEAVRYVISASAMSLTGMFGMGAYMSGIFLNTMRIQYANQKIKEYKAKLSDYVDVKDYEVIETPLLR